MNDGFRRRLQCPPIWVGCFWSVLRFLGERSSLAILEIIGLPFILDSGIYTIQKYNMFEVPACYRTYYILFQVAMGYMKVPCRWSCVWCGIAMRYGEPHVN